jgi:hypothetical protein
MPQIYEDATLVLLWLGPEADYSSMLFDVVSVGAAQDFGTEWITQLYEASANRGPNNFFDILMELLTREYWTRLWIVQEIAYAREVIICCGSAQMPYINLVKMLKAFKRHEMDATMALSYIGRIVRLYLGAIGPVGLKYPGSARTNDDFEDPAWMLARNATSKKCRDPRDRIYGCRGLFSPHLRGRIPVNYSLGPDEIIMGATRSIIEVTGRLDIILLKRRSVNGPESESWQKTLPSWVPELDDKVGQREIFFDMLNPKYDSNACGSKEGNCQFLEGGRVLRATGILIGHIDKIHERNYRPGERMYGEEHEHVDLIKYIFGFQQYLGERVDSRAELIMFWSTILGTFLQSHLVFETPRSQKPGTEVFRAKDGASDAIVNLAIELQEMSKRVEERRRLTGFLQSLLRTPSFTKHQTAFIEPIYRHLDYRILFSFQRSPLNARETPQASENEIPRPINIGVAPCAAQEGDVVCVMHGCKVPVVLRPEGQRFLLIGDAHLDNFMSGAAFGSREAGFEATQEFLLQ